MSIGASRSKVVRYAVLDIGSNTVKLTIVEQVPTGFYKPIVDVSATTRLGEDIQARRLTPAAIDRTIDMLLQSLAVCARYEVNALAAVATSAVRDAVNADEFVGRAAEYGICVTVLTGDEEARLSTLAVVTDPDLDLDGPITMVDIGGGSTEIAIFEPGHGQDRRSLQLGCVRLTEAILKSDPTTLQEMQAARQAVSESMQGRPPVIEGAPLIGVGGTMTNMGRVCLARTGLSANLHGLSLSMDEVRAQIDLYASRPIAERKQIAGLDPERADIILAGALILEGAMDSARIGSATVSCRGLRWGVLYDRFQVTTEPSTPPQAGSVRAMHLPVGANR